MKRYTFTFTSTSEAGCSACGLVFVNTDSFDTHRGIAHPVTKRQRKTTPIEDDERQDLGRCRTPAEMLAKGLKLDEPTGRWGNDAGLALVEKMRRMRGASNG